MKGNPQASFTRRNNTTPTANCSFLKTNWGEKQEKQLPYHSFTSRLAACRRIFLDFHNLPNYNTPNPRWCLHMYLTVSCLMPNSTKSKIRLSRTAGYAWPSPEAPQRSTRARAPSHATPGEPTQVADRAYGRASGGRARAPGVARVGASGEGRAASGAQRGGEAGERERERAHRRRQADQRSSRRVS